METMNPQQQHLYLKMLEDRFLSAQRDLECYKDRVQLYASKFDEYRLAAKAFLAKAEEFNIPVPELPEPPDLPDLPDLPRLPELPELPALPYFTWPDP